MYYGRTTNGGAHFPFNFGLSSINKTCDGTCIGQKVKEWIDSMPENASANWVVSIEL